MIRTSLIAVILVVASAGFAAADGLGSLLAPPTVRLSGGRFDLSARILADGHGSPAWSCRLYFDTDFDPSAGWLPRRGYDYVACPSPRGGSLRVMRTPGSNGGGTGGRFCGYGLDQTVDHTLHLSVPLDVLSPSDGRLAWELMVFDGGGEWVGSYGGRFTP